MKGLNTDQLIIGVVGGIMAGFAGGIGFFLAKRVMEGKKKSLIVEKEVSNFTAPRETHGWFNQFDANQQVSNFIPEPEPFQNPNPKPEYRGLDWTTGQRM